MPLFSPLGTSYVTDLINRIVLILKRDLKQFRTNIRDIGLLDQEDLGNKG